MKRCTSLHYKQYLVLLLFGSAAFFSSTANAGEGSLAGQFEPLGQPVSIGRLHATCAGPDGQGRDNWIYQAFGQAGRNGAFLLATVPSTGVSTQFFLPESTRPGGARGIKTIFPHENIVYVGTYQSAYLLRFDPARPEMGLQVCGDGPLNNAAMVWQICAAADGRLYFTTSGQDCKLFSYDGTTNQFTDHGRVSPGNRYAQEMVTSADRQTLFIAVGTRSHDVVAYDVETGQRRSLLVEAERKQGFLSLRPESFVRKKNIDVLRDRSRKNSLYAVPHSNEYAIGLGRAEIRFPKATADQWLADGSRVISGTATELVLENRAGTQKKVPLKYRAGAQLMTFWPWDERIYFSTTAPLRVGYYDQQSYAPPLSRRAQVTRGILADNAVGVCTDAARYAV